MELDDNICRLLRLILCKMKKNYRKYIAYIYLIVYYMILLNYLASGIFQTIWPIKPFLVLLTVVCFYMLFLIINHVIVCKYIDNHVLLLVESLLVISILICIKTTCVIRQ